MIIGVTGHRPDKLYGYDLNNIRYINMKNYFKSTFINKKCDEVISGMALGVDTIVAISILELKEEGYNIKLTCALPCRNQESKWIKQSIDLYHTILSKADNIVYVSETYNTNAMQKRNMYMVDHSDEMIAIWDGSSGGTSNCVSYAKKKKKNIYRVLPSFF